MSLIRFAAEETPGLVSVVIPTRNGERFIAETLDSIGRQTYPHWEVIVVEDGSTGPTEQIVADFAQRHPWNRVSYTRNETNFGASYSRNVAFAQAAGQYVALLDGDDRWLPDHLASAVEELQSSAADIVYSTVVMVEDQTGLVLGIWGPDANEIAAFPHGLYRRNFVTPSASVMRRQVLADVGPWNTSCLYCEDLDFWLRCVAAGKTFRLVGGTHCLYRKNHAGATTQKMCGTSEECAVIAAAHLGLPGLRQRCCRRSVAKSFARAAGQHARSKPKWDPSADASRAPALMLQAWKLRPKRVSYLLLAGWWTLRNALRRRRAASQVPPVAYQRMRSATTAAPRRAAA
ncbi:MAG TPA: glycosyltransferase family 2 protein [Lacipirellulaceae bacterium]|nr:glycosyltransferase family 2 protein [Lacipirellulaceae bacterium]HMP07509.1 glycosyltransferase family 2 protein [Lacipirellulaceae bacterium]